MSMLTYAGLRIVASPFVERTVEDWSRVRSPGRARRRLKLGHRQNVVRKVEPCAYQIGDVIYAHPDIVAQLNAALHKDRL